MGETDDERAEPTGGRRLTWGPEVAVTNGPAGQRVVTVDGLDLSRYLCGVGVQEDAGDGYHVVSLVIRTRSCTVEPLSPR